MLEMEPKLFIQQHHNLQNVEVLQEDGGAGFPGALGGSGWKPGHENSRILRYFVVVDIYGLLCNRKYNAMIGFRMSIVFNVYCKAAIT